MALQTLRSTHQNGDQINGTTKKLILFRNVWKAHKRECVMSDQVGSQLNGYLLDENCRHR